MTRTQDSDRYRSALDALYSSDLLYVPECWKLCGDAHCCGFARYKSRFKILTNKPFQSLPLLPGEYDYLQSKGWTAQFGEHEHRVTPYAIDDRVIVVEELVSRRSGCCCEHMTRTVVCRLYPLLPVLDIDGQVVGIDDRFGSFEELEAIDTMPMACQVRAIPFDQTDVFLSMSRLIGSIPEWNFALQAYQLTRRHVFDRVRDGKARSGKSAFELFETMYFMRRLFDHDELKKSLCALADRFEARYGPDLVLTRTGTAS